MTVLIAVGSGKVNVPNIVGLTASDADKALRGKNLSLGQSSPTNADPKAKISSQIPAADEVVKAGTPVNIFFPDPTAAANKKAGDKAGGRPRRAARGAAGAAGAGAQGHHRPGHRGQGHARHLRQEAGRPRHRAGVRPSASATSPSGTPFATDPAGGTKVGQGRQGQGARLGRPAAGRLHQRQGHPAHQRRHRRQARPGRQDRPPTRRTRRGAPTATTSPTRPTTGVMLKDITKKNAQPLPLTKAGDSFENLAWAPTADINVLAMNDVKDSGDTDLCLARVKSDCDGRDVQGRAVVLGHPRDPLGAGRPLDPGPGRQGPGLVRDRALEAQATASRPFSPDVADWTPGHFMTSTDKSGKGVLDAAISPDGKQLALVSNVGSSFYRLVLATARTTSRWRSSRSRRRSGLQGRLAQRQPGAAARAGRRGVSRGRLRARARGPGDDAQRARSERLRRRRIVPAAFPRRLTGCCAPAVAASSSGERATAAAVGCP